ncbi:MAG: HAD-IIIC family phosphatase [Caulobacter sp.]|nr:HAD-IIIC family phosphatase [Caulobacter sp.]
MSLDLADFFWRPERRPDWDAALKAAMAGIEAAAGSAIPPAALLALKGLAGERPGPLDSLKLGKAAARLALGKRGQSVFRPLRIALAGAANTSLLAADLPAAGLARGLLIEVVEAPFDTAPALAAGRITLPGEDDLDAVLVLAPGDDPAQLAAGLRSRLGAAIILATTPVPAGLASADLANGDSARRRILDGNIALADGAAEGGWQVWDLAGLAAEVGTSRFFDTARYLSARLPFAAEYSLLAADHLCRLLAAMAGVAGRALVLDLDNTVWGGVIGDDGLEGLVLGAGSPEGEAFVAIQRLALHLRTRGVVLAVCSKNTETVARRGFAHPEMLLSLEDIAVFHADWSDKAAGMTAIAEALDLSPSALVLLDDNPAERAWVRQALPQAMVPELPADPAGYPAALIASGVFEHLPLTAEDAGRAASYAARAVVARARSGGDYDAWLAGLDMTLTVAPFDAVGRGRIAQLIARSNQFNLTARRYNETEVAALEADPAVLTWQARLSDRLADHGMIGVVIVRRVQGPDWVIDSWLMSCRVLERGVEQALMNRLIAEARAAGAETLTGRWIDSGRNGLVANFYDRMGFSKVADGEWRLDLHTATELPTDLVADLRGS